MGRGGQTEGCKIRSDGRGSQGESADGSRASSSTVDRCHTTNRESFPTDAGETLATHRLMQTLCPLTSAGRPARRVEGRGAVNDLPAGRKPERTKLGGQEAEPAAAAAGAAAGRGERPPAAACRQHRGKRTPITATSILLVIRFTQVSQHALPERRGRSRCHEYCTGSAPRW